jgi:hypothetical protein
LRAGNQESGSGSGEVDMSAKDDGGPAFPLHTDDGRGYEVKHLGMSLRDYFAAHAPAKEIEDLMPSSVKEAAEFLGKTIDEYKYGEDYYKAIARRRYEWADAMLAERQK